MEKPCGLCGRLFITCKSRFSKRRFCSHSCSSKSRYKENGMELVSNAVKANKLRQYKVGSESPSWKGGEQSGGGRVRVYQGIGVKSKMRYRKVAEDVLQRTLLKREVVHHINNISNDDRPSNLFVFRHKAAHQRWHEFLKRHQLSGSILQSNL